MLSHTCIYLAYCEELIQYTYKFLSFILNKIKKKSNSKTRHLRPFWRPHASRYHPPSKNTEIYHSGHVHKFSNVKHWCRSLRHVIKARLTWCYHWRVSGRSVTWVLMHNTVICRMHYNFVLRLCSQVATFIYKISNLQTVSVNSWQLIDILTDIV